MTRAAVVSAINSYLSAAYDGPIAIHSETSSQTTDPPYAVIRIGSGDQLYPGQAEIWDMNVMVGVFHDSDETSAATAESQAGTLFALLDDPDDLFAASGSTLAWSAWERSGTEASITETRWQHVAVFRAIVAPAAES